jgi:site-specific recombinase XerD
MAPAAQSPLPRIIRPTDLQRQIREFLIDREASGFSPRTVEFYDDELRYFTTFLGDKAPASIRDITPDHCRAYFIALAKRRNNGGVHCAFRAIRAFLNWYQREYQPANWQSPLRNITVRKPKLKPIPPVPLTTIKAMLATCQRRTFVGDRDYALILCLLDTGCRATEFLSLNIADIDMQRGTIYVTGKGDKRRVVFLGAKSRRELARYLRHRPHAKASEPLWTTSEGERLQRWGLTAVLRRRQQLAGVEEHRPHSFRRAFALLAKRGGADLLSIQQLLGHSDLRVTRLYLDQQEDDLREEHRKGGPVDRWL